MGLFSVADVKMEIPVLVQSLKSSTMSSTSLQLDKTFRGVLSAAVQSNQGLKANMVDQGDGNFSSKTGPRIPPSKKKRWTS